MADSPLWLASPPPTSPKPKPRSKRRAATRSVAGCLTCRHRRVKCAVQASTSTCDNCRRLGLDCTPSFGYNFKSWTPSGGRASPSGRRSPSRPDGSRSRPSPQYSHQKSPVRRTSHSPTPRATETVTLLSPGSPQSPLDVSYWSTLDSLYQDGPSSHTRLDSPQLRSDAFGSSAMDEISQVLPVPSRSDDGSPEYVQNSGVSVNNDSMDSVAFSSGSELDILPFMDNQSVLDTVPDHLNVFGFSSSPTMDSLAWGLAPQMPLVYGNSHGDLPLLDKVDAWVPELLTLKDSMWNPYRYMVNSTMGQHNSPLRHAVLSWTCAYLSYRERESLASDTVYYVAASKAVKTILEDLSSDLELVPSISRESKAAEKLYMLLSTSFFLCSRDFMLSDSGPLHERLDLVKRFFQQNWYKLRGCLTGLDSRLLLWLAYMDLRASLFRGHVFRLDGLDQDRRAGDNDMKPPKAFVRFLDEVNALPDLRNHPTGQSYLSDCFGKSYPKEEIEEDSIQEPCHKKCDDVLSILSSVSEFEQWDEEYSDRTKTESLVRELREAKIQALRANISRIKAECAVLFNKPLYESRSAINRTTFHALTVTSLHLSATILLNRIVEPNVRTDPEAQTAAHELLRIAQRLRKAKYLERPRWLIWPLPLFVAGIEIEDEIYQEWLLDYISELEHWGASMRKMRGLLERIITRQQAEGRRVKVREMVHGFESGITV